MEPRIEHIPEIRCVGVQYFGYIYGQWLPKSGFRQAGPYDLERYDARFKGPDDDESVMEICVPIA